ncbi:Arc family DNA-binding protein [Acinetobacter sp. YH12103]|uniref:Arc family DNA-binding protein n=1 Tax=Acinetobacter sp. YH12103 TaxID=2601092 RepID=UPI0015D25B87|nr:Arc family DNA-binding protein [Acinetobacter sp. YH12103]
MSREDPQLKIRLPLELKEKITESAAEYGRSINSEVVIRLEESFSQNLSAVEKIPTEVLMMELASRMKGYSLTVEEVARIKKAP